MVERTFGEVVFDEQESSTDAAGVEQEWKRVAGVMQDVHKQAAIEGSVGKRQAHTIEGPAGNGAIGAREHFDAVDLKIRNGFAEERREFAIAATDVEELSARGEHR